MGEIGARREAPRASEGNASLEALLALFARPTEDLDRRRADDPHLPNTHVLCDLLQALAQLERGERFRASVRVRLADEPCEIGLEAAGTSALASVYTGGNAPFVHLYERSVSQSALAASLRAAISLRAGAQAADDARLTASSWPAAKAPRAPREVSHSLVEVAPSADASFGLSCQVALKVLTPERARPRRDATAPKPPTVLRTELLPLLPKGKLRIHAHDHVRELAEVHVFLLAEQLAKLALEAARAAQEGRSFYQKVVVGGGVVGVRLSSRSADRRVALTVGGLSSRGENWTFPALEISSLLRATVEFGRGLSRALVSADRAQAHNLRLVEFRALLRELSELMRESFPRSSVINESPESYRAYARTSDATRTPPPPVGRIRFAPKWTAAVPSIDLRSTFLCGESVVVGSLREVSAIDRSTGSILWTRQVSKGVSVVTPAGLARFANDGELSLLDLATGETKRSLRLAPRAGAPVTGAVVGGAGLPRMLVISEGKKDLSCIDLDAGEVLWRYAARRPCTFRLKRAGRLVIVSSAEHALTAIDAVSGEVVWRHCDQHRFSHAAAVTDDALFAVAGEGLAGSSGSRLAHLNPWSGEHKWTADLGDGRRPIGAPLVGRNSVVVAALGRSATEVIGFDRKTGERVFERRGSAGFAAPLLLDDAVTLNGETGEFVAFDVDTGELRYSHVFATGGEGDRPRRLEPVLRAGALFVPQGAVHVVRPGDGALLGNVPVDLVPDLLRVDERCDVYVAEESGHVAAFSAGARLTLLKSP